MRKRVLVILAVLLVLTVALTLGLYFTSAKSGDSETQEELIGINEVGKLIEEGNTEKASEKLEKLADGVRNKSDEKERDVRILIVGGCGVACLLIIGAFVFITVLHPLNKISKYTTEIAKGNTDIPLDYDRGSEVGEFSWAFDSMRRELNKARASEKEAIENNKTVIATLSHDIKTPITSIRAYAEGLEANLDSSPEKRAQYLQILMKKCDEVSKVTDDLLLHSLSDMHRLKVEKQEIEIRAFTEGAVRDLDPEGKEIVFTDPGFTESVGADPDRLLQCIENLVTNARKYAPGRIDVYLERTDGNEPSVAVCVKDSGKGIPDEDMPFIFDKFYRGRNHGEAKGSGLGLYIVRYLMEQMDGRIELRNTGDGLLAKLILKVS